MPKFTRRRVLVTSAVSGGLVTVGGAAPAHAEPRVAGRPVAPATTITPADAQYPDLVRGTNLRFVGSPDAVHLVHSTEQVVATVRQAVQSGRRLAVRSGGHCYENFVADPAVRVVIDLSPMRAITFDPVRNAFCVEAGATLGEVNDTLYKGWGSPSRPAPARPSGSAGTSPAAATALWPARTGCPSTTCRPLRWSRSPPPAR
ncbi:hypothetical protein GCM10027610_039110 [Dactylosporangium cerinum]